MEKIILLKEQKILLIEILKAGEMTKEQAKEIIKPFENHLTIAEAKEFMQRLDDEV